MEFPCSPEDLPPAFLVEGPTNIIASIKVAEAECKMKKYKDPDTSGIVA